MNFVRNVFTRMEINRIEKSNFTIVYGLKQKNYINLNKIRLSNVDLNGVSKINYK